MNEATNISTVCNYLLDQSYAQVIAADVTKDPESAPKPMTMARLHMLVYFCDGWHLAEYGVPLFHESPIASSSTVVYHTIMHQLPYGESDPTVDRMNHIGPVNGFWICATPPRPDPETAAFLDHISEVYSGLTDAAMLHEITRMGTPYHRTKVLTGRKGIPFISKGLIKDWFEDELVSMMEEDESPQEDSGE